MMAVGVVLLIVGMIFIRAEERMFDAPPWFDNIIFWSILPGIGLCSLSLTIFLWKNMP